jgi:LasA protease
MQMRTLRPNLLFAVAAFAVLFGILLTCALAIQKDKAGFFSVSGKDLPAFPTSRPPAAAQAQTVASRTPRGPILTPTPDAPHPLPAIRTKTDQYTVRPSDTLGLIAQRYGVSIDQLVQANSLANPDVLPVGVVLIIPAPNPGSPGPDFKVLPDSELVYGPATTDFDIAGFIREKGGFLAHYQEEVDKKTLSGAQIVQGIAQDYSVNPRLLLAVLEYQSGWVTNPNPKKAAVDYPIGLRNPQKKGLYSQLSWAADNLNRGYYLWRVNGVASWLLSDGTIVPVAPTINAGTAGVQQLFALLYNQAKWTEAASENGLFATYNALFGYPFDYTVEPLVPPGLTQPKLQLPFEPGADWAFTGGPHGGWGEGSAWAALDFAPPGDALGCVLSNDWVVAMADGLITRAQNGAVIQDLDGDGFEQTGWVILYMHIETRDRVQPGTFLKAGQRIGHPSCEGGVSTGTHTHLARRYNGEWIPADQNIPFVMDGWISQGTGQEYDGYLVRGDQSKEAYAGRTPNNSIQR